MDLENDLYDLNRRNELRTATVQIDRPRFRSAARTALAALSLAVGTVVVGAPNAPMFEAPVPWDDISPGPTDLSGLSPDRAGAKGFVTVRDGHLYTGDQRLRLFGVNVAFGTAIPTREQAAIVAKRFAKLGINAVRIMQIDASVSPNGILKSDRQTFDPAMLDRLDYFIAQLAAAGIYIDLPLHTYRIYPGLPNVAGMPPGHKAVDMFNARALELQRSYNKELLTHINPYTGLSLANDPAVALVEISNEDGLNFFWGVGKMDNLPEPLLSEFQAQWNTWLSARYPDTAALSGAWSAGTRRPGKELLKNGDFSKQLAGWQFMQGNGAKGTIGVSPVGPSGGPAAVMAVQKAGKNPWDLQLQTLFPIKEGVKYQLTFKARNNVPGDLTKSQRVLSLAVQKATPPYAQYYGNGYVMLTEQWGNYAYTFTPDVSDPAAAFAVSNMGAQNGSFQIADVSIRPAGYTGLAEAQALGQVAIVKRGGDYSLRTEGVKRDWTQFMLDTENRYWSDMQSDIKGTLGYRGVVMGSQISFSPVQAQARLDAICENVYWDHPVYLYGSLFAGSGVLHNSPMTGNPLSSTLRKTAMLRVKDKPYIITEYGHPSPNYYSVEGFPLVAVYGGFQDWDGIFLYTYSGGQSYTTGPFTQFPFYNHPGKMAVLPQAALMFRRGDIPAGRIGRKSFLPASEGTLFERLKSGKIETSVEVLGAGRLAAFQQRVAVAMNSSPRPIRERRATYEKPSQTLSVARFGPRNGPEAPVGVPADDPVPGLSGGRKDRLIWATQRANIGSVTVATSWTKAAIGSITGRLNDLGLFQVRVGRNPLRWASMVFTSLPADPANPGVARWLLTATATAANSGMELNNGQSGIGVLNWGTAPTLAEGIAGTVDVRYDADRVSAWSLDMRGQRLQQIPITATGRGASFRIDPAYRALSYEIDLLP